MSASRDESPSTNPESVPPSSTGESGGEEPAPASVGALARTQQQGMKFCNRCGQVAPALEDGSCTRCGSLVAARTLPLLARSTDLRISRAGRFEDDEDDASHAKVRADPLIGVVVADRYRILELLGRGGMGIVYKVEHTRIGKLLALKLLAGELSRNQEVVRRFKHEALTASKLSSPNTVQVFDYGVSEGLTYLVMELVTGDDLGRVLKNDGKLSAAQLGRIVVQVASSLAEAHGQGIVHRDIKPENVMLLKGRDGSDLAKVLDFGLAKLREGAELSELTSQGAIVGTPYFMSPEQVRGDPVDNRSDIYSLGALMYRGLTGVYPFQGTSPMAVFAKHLTEVPPPPHEVDPSVPPGMSEIVVRALAKDPGDRFQRVEDLQAAVVAELQELGTSGIETLLDSGALRKLAPRRDVAEAKDAAIATRDELEGYERKLRRNRIFMTAMVLLVPLAGLGAGAHYLLKERPVTFSGTEEEPNDEVGQANKVPFGHPVSAMVGKRLSQTESDRDFFEVTVPEGPRPVSIALTTLPNIPLCLQVFPKGASSPSAQYCPGRIGLDLSIPTLKMDAGTYLFAVIQDLDARGGGTAPFIYENVSDSYVLTVAAASEEGTVETEPNDAAQHAQTIRLGDTLSGTLSWVGDVDFYCPLVEGTGLYRFTISDEPREGGAVLAAARVVDGAEGPPVRVHSESTMKASSTDVPSPFRGFEFRGAAATCLSLRAVVNPKDTAQADVVVRGSKATYRVTLEPKP